MPSHVMVSHISTFAGFDLASSCLPGHPEDIRRTGGDVLDLEGKLLIAMPSMGDPRFEHAVIFVCAYSDKGAMGLIINKPSADVRMSDLLEQLDLQGSPDCLDMPVHFGGPVETGRGFVLHSNDYRSSLQSMDVRGGYCMTATMDILEEIARGSGPDRALMILGYSGWGPGQLEEEIAQNGWLTTDASPQIVFQVPAASKWSAAMESLGIDPITLSATAGHA